MTSGARGKGVRVGYFDCFSGISGDMTLGRPGGRRGRSPAHPGGGVQPGAARAAVSFETVRKGGFRATHAKVHAPHEHAHRHWHHIEAIIDTSILTARQKDLAKRIFLRLGEAEAKVHGVDLSKIHFHEVGAVDSIIDIVGSAVGLDLLGVDRFEASPVPPGKGWIKAAHGRMALPAPATAEMLKGVPLAESMVEMELTTPTGRRNLDHRRRTIRAASRPDDRDHRPGCRHARPARAGQHPAALPGHRRAASGQRPGLGAGDEPRRPARRGGRLHDDHADGSRCARRLHHAHPDEEEPAGRDGQRALRRGRIPAMEEVLFRETATLGIRRYPVSRHKLKRQAIEVETRFGPIRGKLGWLENRPPTFSPEYDDCARLASSTGGRASRGL